MKKLCILIAAVGLLAGCAHPISIGPATAALNAPQAGAIQKNVAYLITDADREKEVVTPGGGGDEVSYKPYAQLEPALYTVLTSRYKAVYLVQSLDDPAIVENDISLVFVPTVETTSSSNNPLTWPPENFTVTLACVATDGGGEQVWQATVTGEGTATFSEYTKNFAHAAHIASANAFNQLAAEIDNASELK